MKSWIWVLVAIVGGYYAYRSWFGGDETDQGEPPIVLEVPDPPDAPPSGSDEVPAAADEPERPRIDLDVGGAVEAAPAPPARDDEAWTLERQRREAEQAGNAARAQELAAQIVSRHADSDPARWLQYEQGRAHLQRYYRIGKTKEGLEEARHAWRLLTPALFLREARESERQALRETLAKLANDLLFGGRHVEGVDVPYVPKSGDVLSRLCRKTFPGMGAQVAPGFVVDVNRLGSAANLRAGEPVRVPLGRSEIVVVKSEFRLYFLHDGCYVKDFPVGLGREGSTPEGSFEIEEKIKNPDWNPRAGVTIPYGHPENILGSRWMAFRDTADYSGFGIHGTTDPASIGKEASSGCVRMLRADVEQLFEWTARGTAVRVRR